jgi:hypothetical protein
VYKEIQGMFNAKPDLAIVAGDYLVVVEAKLTGNFQEEQMRRTAKIVEVWAKLLYADLGFAAKPCYTVIKLGLAKTGADLTWEELENITRKYYSEHDRTVKCLEYGIRL